MPVGAAGTTVEFINTYYEVSASLQAQKEYNNWNETARFTFTLTALNGAPMPADATGTTKTGTVNTAQRYVNFGNIVYTEAKRYEYTIAETVAEADKIPGVTYDTTPHNAVVEVTADKQTGALTAVVKYDGEGSLTITNTYSQAKARLQATKSFNDWSKANSFTFTLTALNGAPMPAGVTGTSISKNATEANPTVNFGEIAYTTGGTYEYTIKETVAETDKVPGVTYDDKTHNVVVTVAPDTITGELTAVVKYDGNNSLTITNTYQETTATLEVTKSFNSWGKANSFTFNLAALNGAPMPAGITGTSISKNATEANPTVNFGSITYKTEGTYKYTITEVNDGVPGVTYDARAHSAVVTVTAGTDGELTASVKYDDKTDPLTITNTYHEVEAKAELKVTKNFNNWGKANSFTFNLAAVNGAPMPTNTTATATEAAKTATFGEITYKAAGTYEYTITEVNDGVPGVTYDTTPHKVTVTVTSGTDGKLTAAVKYDGKESLTITNTYESGFLVIEKTVTGNLADKNKYFTFKITLNVDGSYPYEVSNGKTGTIRSGGTIQLKHGESVIIRDLPAGCKYQVTESDSYGYRTYSSGDSGRIGRGSTSTAGFINSRSTAPATGERDYLNLSLSTMLLSGLGMIATFFSGRKRKEKMRRQK